MTDPYGVIDLSTLKNSGPAGGSGGGEEGRFEITLTETNLEQVIQESATQLTLLAVVSSRIPEVDTFLADLRSSVEAKGGVVRLAVLDADAEPRVAAALRVQLLPALLLLVKGQLQPIVEALLPLQEIQGLLDQMVELAKSQGFDVPEADADQEEQSDAPPEKPLPPLVQKAYDAIDAGDLAAATAAFEEHLNQSPADAEAKAGLAMVRLLERTREVDPEQARRAAADTPADLAAQLVVADVDMLGGHVEDAFTRLLDQLRGADADTKATVRTRLLDLFEVAGNEDPRVAPARKRLANLLF
jgi:putative thioredoxin